VGDNHGFGSDIVIVARLRGLTMYRLKSSKLVGKRIMIVEADQDVVEIMESAVASASGVVVFRAETVDQAVEMLPRLPHVDCLLVDVETVEQSGRHVVKFCKEQGIDVVLVAGDDASFC
jgi:DNA-binding NtrC family response regulator